MRHPGIKKVVAFVSLEFIVEVRAGDTSLGVIVAQRVFAVMGPNRRECR